MGSHFLAGLKWSTLWSAVICLLYFILIPIYTLKTIIGLGVVILLTYVFGFIKHLSINELECTSCGMAYTSPNKKSKCPSCGTLNEVNK
jgi:hypothetical protein